MSYSGITSKYGLVSMLLIILMAILVACGGAAATPTPTATSAPSATSAPEATAEPTTESVTSPVPTAQPAATPAPTAAPVISRELVFVSVDQPNHLDWTDGNTGGTTEFFRDNFNDTLTWKPIGSSEVQPRLAESWEQVASDEWVWKLREDVTYHNGEKWNAPAAAHNLNLSYITERNHGLPTYLGYYNVEWSADDEFTLRQKCPEACIISPLAHTPSARSGTPPTCTTAWPRRNGPSSSRVMVHTNL
ncbi:MAG TPA: ABC transporter substrate-binding protein [Dehalococcoidia bacterium]|nr:ABC transporter substrate-binding protein [Dehalococcoidia bacterium]